MGQSTELKCTIRKLPPETREVIFKLVIQEWLDEDKNHPSRRLVSGGYSVDYEGVDESPPLERALILEKGMEFDL